MYYYVLCIMYYSVCIFRITYSYYKTKNHRIVHTFFLTNKLYTTLFLVIVAIVMEKQKTYILINIIIIIVSPLQARLCSILSVSSVLIPIHRAKVCCCLCLATPCLHVVAMDLLQFVVTVDLGIEAHNLLSIVSPYFRCKT